MSPCVMFENMNMARRKAAKLILIFAVGLLGVSYQMEVKIDYWTSTDYTNVQADQDELFRFLTNTDQVGKWFSWVSYIRPADQRPLGINKKYEAVYKLPVIGEYGIMLNTVDYAPRQKIVLESGELLKPRIEIHLKQLRPRETRMTMTIHYRRYSVLFNIFVAPLLSLLTSQQVQLSLFTIRMFFPK